MMNTKTLSLSLAAAVALAACGGHRDRPASAPVAATYVAPAIVTYPSGAVAVVPAPGAVIYERAAVLRPGFGKIAHVQALVYPNGSSAGMQRLTLSMEDGTTQIVDTRGPQIAMGERVEITADRGIRYPLAASRR